MIASLGLLKGAIQNQDSIIINILITGNSVFHTTQDGNTQQRSLSTTQTQRQHGVKPKAKLEKNSHLSNKQLYIPLLVFQHLSKILSGLVSFCVCLWR